MRFGTKQDVPFIIAVIRDGMQDGYFNLYDDDGLSQFEKSGSQKPLPVRNVGRELRRFLVCL